MDLFNTGNTFGEDTIEGTPGNDNLSGGSGSTLIGQDGNDFLSGGSGGNTLTGDAGNDTLTGGSGSNNLTGGSGNDLLSGGSGSNELIGDAGNDILTGGSGGNNLDGGEDNDYLQNGSGFNNFTGGSGADSFFLRRSQPSLDTGGGGTIIIDGELITDGNGEAQEIIGQIADFNSAEGDRILIDSDSFEVAPGDVSTLQFDNNTGVLSLADKPVVEVLNGVDADVLANTQVVEGGGGEVVIGDDVAIDDDTVVIDDNGDDTIVDSDGDGNLEIYRFFEPDLGFHFYTSSETEKDTILEQIDNGEVAYTFEGESFTALAEDDDGAPLTGAKPVYRFFNELTGTHLYTISEPEKDNIVDNIPDYNLEGVAYYAYDTPQENTTPLYRLYNSETRTHFFTPSVSERDDVLGDLPGYSAEGEDAIAFHVLPVDV